MNYPKTVEELIHWDVSIERDTYGNYTIITGFEGTGGCFWCGKDLEGRRRRFCGGNSGHWTRYQEYFSWNYAKSLSIKRAEHCCENCGVPQDVWGPYMISTLEAHHIIPLKGGERVISVFNVPWNLICLCHKCHQLIHAVMRKDKALIAKPDIFELALARGQMVFNIS